MKEKKPEFNTFDIYRLFSRWDVLLAIILVVALLVAAMLYFYGGSDPIV